jgi:hypothetical protein
MRWYSASIIMKSDVSGTEALCELSIRLVRANDRREAGSSAEAFGRKSEHEYLNDEGKLVKWRFARVEDIQEIADDDLKSGTEVYSRLDWPSG